MVQIAVDILKWVLRIGLVTSALFAFVIVLNIGLGLMMTPLDGNLLTDLLAMVQMWLPFNINVIFGWFTVTVTAYILFRLTMLGVTWINFIIRN